MTIVYVLFAVFLLFLFFLYRKRRSYYPYSVHSDYLYNMPDGDIVLMKDGRLELPDTEGFTVFVKVKTVSSFWGYFLHPSVEIKSSGESLRQYTEYGSSGYRYINLSGCGRHVKLKGRRLRIKDGETEVYRFKNPELEGKKILIVAPHPDDAEIAAYGLYGKYADNVFIMTLSPGENGYFHYKELFTEEERTLQHLKKGELRMWNSLTVPLIAGVKPENLISFGYFNETFEDMYRFPDKEIPSRKFDTADVNIFRKFNTNPLVKKLKGGSNWKALKENITMVVENVQPDVIVTPHPHIDSHEDHRYATLALLETLKEMKYTRGLLLLYTNHFHYYPFGRMGGVMPLPPCFDGSISHEGIYSHPLNREERRNKLLAFDAMNDLRPNTDYRLWKRLFARAFSSLRARCFSIEKDYFNLYIRTNELFYVFPVERAISSGIFEKPAPPEAFP